tara:strand:- start:140 stop:1195 length:1056 start_codon:yes stop_codon:yes gene_type:complete
MAINFPDNPTSNQIYSEVNKSWKWNGSAWVGIASTGPQGEPGPKGDIGLQGFVGETGVIQETQTWENVTYNFDVDYTNDTGAPLDIRLYVQNDNTAAGPSDISLHAIINGVGTISFVESFRLEGAGAHDDVGNITIPTGATFKFSGSTGGGSPNFVWKRMVRTQVIVEQQTPSVTGTATFTASTNNIALAGIDGLTGLADGDVIEVTGSASNDGVYTAESITTGNVIVNAAHAGGTTSKSLTDEAIDVTVTLVAKANVAALGYGQGWVDVTLDRAVATNYTNSTGRSIMLLITKGDDGLSSVIIDGISLPGWRADGATNIRVPMSVVVPPGSTYSLGNPTPGNFQQWAELR